MKQHLTYRLLAVVPALICAVAFAAVRIALPSSLAVSIAAAIVCTALVVLAFLLRKRFLPTLNDGSVAMTFVSSVLGFLLLACFAVSAYSNYFAPLAERAVAANGLVVLLTDLFCLLSALYFLLPALVPSLLSNSALRLFGAFMPILYCAFRILSDFIATGTMPLANGGGYHILGMIATMLFVLSEGKFIAGGGKTVSYLACGQVAIVLNFAYNVPFILTFETAALNELLQSALFLAFSLYIAVRLVSLAGAQTDAETEA